MLAAHWTRYDARVMREGCGGSLSCIGCRAQTGMLVASVTVRRRKDETMVNITSHVWRVAIADPSRTALRSWAGDDWSFAELRWASSRVAGAVREAGLNPLDRVILIA